jgi:hypothetical protein
LKGEVLDQVLIVRLFKARLLNQMSHEVLFNVTFLEGDFSEASLSHEHDFREALKVSLGLETHLVE